MPLVFASTGTGEPVTVRFSRKRGEVAEVACRPSHPGAEHLVATIRRVGGVPVVVHGPAGSVGERILAAYRDQGAIPAASAEAARILAEGLVARPGDIDLLLTHLHGFRRTPADRATRPEIADAHASFERSSFPVALRGNSSRNSTSRGTLYRAKFAFT
ncbi:hypothetical protein [Amycolatopsis sulphurea]|uniref:hypothetical protein n=1 Tax=Amycolatopsis sulphurea TaxID=76022 RepID=UPI003C2DCA60